MTLLNIYASFLACASAAASAAACAAKPGVLIAVMAGAKGIKGKDFPIFKLTFETKKDINESRTAKISITESQLMGDDLKERKCTVVTHPITILP